MKLGITILWAALGTAPAQANCWNEREIIAAADDFAYDYERFVDEIHRARGYESIEVDADSVNRDVTRYTDLVRRARTCDENHRGLETLASRLQSFNRVFTPVHNRIGDRYVDSARRRTGPSYEALDRAVRGALQPPRGWIQVNGEDCADTCALFGYRNANGPYGNACTSGEVLDPSVERVDYLNGCWPDCRSTGRVESARSDGAYCYGVDRLSGRDQDRDDDRTDVTMGCYCR